MKNNFLTESPLPFCKGCTHATISQNTAIALEKLNLKPLDVILVTDIGCHGIVDKNFMTHTVHGLHGRSVALASGISIGLSNSNKKIIVFIGDGGATIGMQHIIDAAHHNFNITIIVHNNMLYGMTGGQASEFTPKGFKTVTIAQGENRTSYDICELAVAAGASYVSRIIGIGDFSEQIKQAIATEGFSLIEVMEICTSYGLKANPGMKLQKVLQEAGIPIKTYTNTQRPKFIFSSNNNTTSSLFESVEKITNSYIASLNKTIRLQLCGSAGEGVQLAAEMFVKAAALSGLNITKKGSYPVTVGIGFSAVDIIISNKEILYTGSSIPDVLIIVSNDGLDYAKKTITNLSKDTIVYLDSSLTLSSTEAQVISTDFRNKLGPKYASIYSLFYYLKHSSIFSIDALKQVFKESHISKKIDIDTILNT